MVWQDYELIPTKRVSKDRIGTRSIFFHRLYLAMGGHTTAYFTVFGLYSVHLWKALGGSLPMAKLPLMLGAGAGALVLSTATVGNSKETLHLMRNYLTYRKEFKMIRDELYY